MFEELKETIPEILKGGMMTMSYSIKNINKKIQIMKKNQMEILVLRNTITEKN